MTKPVPSAVEQQWAIRFQAQCTVCLGLPTNVPPIGRENAVVGRAGPRTADLRVSPRATSSAGDGPQFR